jgi:hypothetical protein
MHLMYKFIILDIERNKIIFLMFLKYKSNSHDFNKLVIACKVKKKTMFYHFLYKKIY